jgi:hypothetical protein
MAATVDRGVLDQVLDPVGRCFTPEVAARIVALRASRRTTQRLGKLAEKNSAGHLTAREEREYSAYVEALDVIAILQAKARNVTEVSGNRK